jgi:hypothetical protein
MKDLKANWRRWGGVERIAAVFTSVDEGEGSR